MDSALHLRYARHLIAVDDLMVAELARWPWADVRPLRDLVEEQIRREGKRLRPLLTFILVDLLAGSFEKSYPAAAGVELYHIASTVMDDVQDNADLRRGMRTIHTAYGTSVAINVAATVRSLSYHPIHRSTDLDPAEKLELHRRLDTAATVLLFGQSIDIGWNVSWYRSGEDFPYERMVEWKTGALFGCAAAMAAIVSGAQPSAIDAAGRFGTAFGALYQRIDDYVDMFGEDLRNAKLTYPVIRLRHNPPSPAAADHDIAAVLRAELHADAAEWVRDFLALFGGQAARGRLDELVALALAPLNPAAHQAI